MKYMRQDVVEMKNVFQKYKRDMILLAAVLAIGGAIRLCIVLFAGQGATAVVRVDGNVLAEYSLSERGSFPIDGYSGGKNLLIIENGEAQITEASCPDGLCIGMGSISKNGQSIICLPNRVSVEIHGLVNPMEKVDGVTR